MTPSNAPPGLLHFLAQYITESRKVMIEKVLEQRTRHLTVVLEDIYQSQNASAVVRTCECMGVQDIHIIESRSKFSVNRKVLMGSSKWVNLIRYKSKAANNNEACLGRLRQSGYTIMATDPSEGISVHEIPTDSKIALVMGNELKGLSSYALQKADVKVRIPMFGFTESFNISVSAAVCLSTLITKIRMGKTKWQLSEPEKSALRLEWYRKCVKHPEILEKEFLSRTGQRQNRKV